MSYALSCCNLILILCINKIMCVLLIYSIKWFHMCYYTIMWMDFKLNCTHNIVWLEELWRLRFLGQIISCHYAPNSGKFLLSKNNFFIVVLCISCIWILTSSILGFVIVDSNFIGYTILLLNTWIYNRWILLSTRDIHYLVRQLQRVDNIPPQWVVATYWPFDSLATWSLFKLSWIDPTTLKTWDT